MSVFLWSCYLRKQKERKKERKRKREGAVVKNPPANAEDTGSSPGPGRAHMPRSN